MATTPTRIFQFIGGPTFEQLFANYEGNPGFHELPGSMHRSELVFFSKFQVYFIIIICIITFIIPFILFCVILFYLCLQ